MAGLNVVTEPSGHRCRVLKSPIEGTYGTQTESMRSYERHTHATYAFGLIEQGAQRSWSARGSVEAFVGDVITCNPGEVHDGHPWDPKGSRRWRMVYLEPTAMLSICGPENHDRAGIGHSASLQLTCPVVRDETLAGLIRGLFESLDQWGDVDSRFAGAEALACDEAMTRAGALLLARYTRIGPGNSTDIDIRNVRDRLAADMLAPPSLAELAAPLGISRFQLLRRFERVYGLPPHRWLIQQRVERARRLIRDGQTLTDAALASGFADQSHLHRHFVVQLGFTPGAWKRDCGER